MKIWNEQAADHSAKLKIIGTFKTIDDANLAMKRMNKVIDLMQEELTYTDNEPFPKKILDYLMKENFILSKEAIDSAELYHGIEQIDKQIVVDTDEITIQLFIESFINCGGKIEIFSKHDYAN